MDTKNPLSVLLRRNRKKLALTYALSLTEQLLALLLPWIIGKAINDLLINQYMGLITFISLWLFLATISVSRKMYDTRVFMNIYITIVTQVIQQQRSIGTPPSKLMARSVLIREVVDFLERDIPNIFAMIISFIGSIIMLVLFDGHIAIVALLMLIPVLALNATLWKPIHRLNHSINNNLERQARIINKSSLPRLEQHFSFMRFLRVKTSDIEARTWGLIELFVVITSIYVFIYTTGKPGIEAGTIFSIVTYFWNFQSSLDRLPALIQSISRVKDIGRRIHDSLLEISPHKN